MRPSRSKEDIISSFRLQESQSPPQFSGMADSVSEDRTEPSAASDLEASRGDSGSMAASGVAVRTSRISSEDEEDDASLWRKTLPAARSSAVARRRSRSSRGGAEERECDGGE
jgi:hypothetical protein